MIWTPRKPAEKNSKIGENYFEAAVFTDISRMESQKVTFLIKKWKVVFFLGFSVGKSEIYVKFVKMAKNQYFDKSL